MEMIVLLKFEVDENQLKDQTKETISKMRLLLQQYAGNAIEMAIQEDGPPYLKLVETACAKMMPGVAEKGLGGPPKMTGGEGR